MGVLTDLRRLKELINRWAKAEGIVPLSTQEHVADIVCSELRVNGRRYSISEKQSEWIISWMYEHINGTLLVGDKIAIDDILWAIERGMNGPVEPLGEEVDLCERFFDEPAARKRRRQERRLMIPYGWSRKHGGL